MLRPLGPVAVFGASNFPLAFSTAGGDTASALAAGCPVIVKGHPAHPGTAELAARAIAAAVRECGLPSGVFGQLNGGAEVGSRLAFHPGLAAIAFTGSRAAGRALFDLAAGRPRPIPVYAEMGSVNPVIFLNGALEARLESLIDGYAASLTLGTGQFCTNPGVVVGMEGAPFRAFLAGTAKKLAAVDPGTMLHDSILERYRAGVRRLRSDARLEVLFAGGGDGSGAAPALFSVQATRFLADAALGEEIFGPAAVAVRCADADELLRVVGALEGQLTATVHFEAADRDVAARVIREAGLIAGRVIANGFPTGVEVCSAMQHGGPYPAATDPRSTSVGTAAILRFVRPVAYQSVPDDLLPPELRDANPGNILRLADGEFTRGSLRSSP
jgi:acyl-CoA reductase-like NAD-dependent aldehyde dehydrogenase